MRIGREEESGLAAVPRFERVMMACVPLLSWARARMMVYIRRYLSIWHNSTSRLGEGYTARLYIPYLSAGLEEKEEEESEDWDQGRIKYQVD
jgi:hypothetical protein